jgi:hypothetical protein
MTPGRLSQRGQLRIHKYNKTGTDKTYSGLEEMR